MRQDQVMWWRPQGSSQNAAIVRLHDAVKGWQFVARVFAEQFFAEAEHQIVFDFALPQKSVDSLDERLSIDVDLIAHDFTSLVESRTIPIM